MDPYEILHGLSYPPDLAETMKTILPIKITPIYVIMPRKQLVNSSELLGPQVSSHIALQRMEVLEYPEAEVENHR